MAYLSGSPHVSKRGIEEIVKTLFGLPIALESIANLEHEMSAAFALAQRRVNERLLRLRVCERFPRAALFWRVPPRPHDF